MRVLSYCNTHKEYTLCVNGERVNFKKSFIHPRVNVSRQRIFAMNATLRIGCISIVIQISVPFMPSAYEQTKNTKSLLVCTAMRETHSLKIHTNESHSCDGKK